MKRVLFASLAVALAAAPLGFASAETAQSGTAHHRQHRSVRADQSQIACTVLGCVPIPANCHPTTGYTWDGSPTGYDVIACR